MRHAVEAVPNSAGALAAKVPLLADAAVGIVAGAVVLGLLAGVKKAAARA